jgi:hypothetical protein
MRVDNSVNPIIMTKYIVFFTLGLFVVSTSITVAWHGGDFDVFLQAAGKLKAGQNIYAPPFINDLQYFYSPFFALLLIPFAHYHFLSEFIWSLLSFFFIYRIWHLCGLYFDIQRLSKKQYRLWIFLVLLLSFQFIKYNISLIQVTIFLLWSCIEAVHMFENKKIWAGAIILAIAVNMKLMPLVLIPYLLYRNYLKETILVIFFIIVLLFVPGLFIGFKANSFLLSEWWHVINPSNKEHLFEVGNGTHSLVALIPVYITDSIGGLPFQRNFLSLSPKTAEIVIQIARLFLIATTLLFLRSKPFTKEEKGPKKFWELSYILLTIPLLFPHQQKYAFLFALPMTIYISYFILSSWDFIVKSPFYKSWAIVFVISMLFYSPFYGSDIIGPFLFCLSQYYRILTFSTLLLIPVSYVFSPYQMHNHIEEMNLKQ